MTSLDVRDVLNLPAEGVTRPRKPKPSILKPNLKGLAREVQSLGGDNPIAIVPAAPSFKKRRIGQRKPAARWKLIPFTNSARDRDPSLVLRHWKRLSDPNSAYDGENSAQDASKPDESAFASFNVQVQVPEYNEDQYNSNLRNPDWTKEETDYLLSLARSFDLRWSLIWDRYDFRPSSVPKTANDTAVVSVGKERDIDDLKARYYEVAAKMMAVQTPVQYMPPQQGHLHNIMANYSPHKERARRKFAIESLSRSKEEAKEEESLLLEVKRILARAEQLNEQRKELYARLDYPVSEGDQNTLKTSEGLQKLLQTLVNTDKVRKRKTTAEHAASPSTHTPVAEAAPGHARRESTASGHTRRDSVGVEVSASTPTGSRAPSKKGSISSQAAVAASTAAQQERRRLTDIEELVYGVTHHDRLTGGATFRYEKINKLFSHKSGQQQQRILNVLSELGIPIRLQMPTSAVVSKFEQLITQVNQTLDSRKLRDKIDVELKTEMAKKQVRLDMEERARKAAAEEENSGEGKERGDEGKEDGRGAGVSVTEVADEDKEQHRKKQGDNQEVVATVAAATNGNAENTEAEFAANAAVNEEATSRPGSSSNRKRSVSVMSSSNLDEEKAAKRQKK